MNDVTVYQTSEQYYDRVSDQCNNIVTVYQTSEQWCDCVSDRYNNVVTVYQIGITMLWLCIRSV